MKQKILNVLTKLKITGLIYKELMLLSRRKKAPILVILLPIILSIVYLSTTYALTNPEITLSVGVCNFDPNPEVNKLISSLSGKFSVQTLDSENCLANLKNKIKDGTFLIGLSIPSDFSSKLSTARQGTLTFYVDESRPALAAVVGLVLNSGLSSYSSDVIADAESELHNFASEARTRLDDVSSVLNLTIKTLSDNKNLLGLMYPLLSSYLNDLDAKLKSYDKDLGFVENISVAFLTNPIVFNQKNIYDVASPISFNFSIIFTIVSLFTLLLLCSTGYIFDKRTNYLLRIRSSKTPIVHYIFIKMIFYSLISGLQFIMILALMIFTQGATFNINFLGLIATFFLITAINSLIGMLIGVIAKTENVAILVSLILTLPFIFLSGGTVPIEFLPGFLQFIANAFPLRLEIQLLKLTTVLGYSIEQIKPLLETGLAYFAVLFALVYCFIKKEH